MPYQGKTFGGSASGEIVENTFKRDSLGPTEVLIRITHSGVCGTDLHGLPFGLVLGHEGVGVVEAVGPAVTKFTTGERAGWGYIHETCGQCKECLSGAESVCQKKHQFFTHDHDQGSFGEIAIWKEDWLFKIPDAMKSEDAAPLMCAGATVFVPLLENTKPTDRVGVVGVGGLGHLAIQFAAKMGCEVVVFSGSEGKRAEALSMGAHEFYAGDFSSEANLKGIDRLVVTSAKLPDWSAYFKVLNPKATIIPLTVDMAGNMSYPHMQSMIQGYKVVGSSVSGRKLQNDMLAFAARAGIKPIIEKFPLTKEGITDVVTKLSEGKVRYRGVLVAA